MLIIELLINSVVEFIGILGKVKFYSSRVLGLIGGSQAKSSIFTLVTPIYIYGGGVNDLIFLIYTKSLCNGRPGSLKPLIYDFASLSL